MNTHVARLLLLAVSIPVLVAASDFNGLVREFSRQTGAHQTKIPFFGLARFVVAVSHPAGTSELKLAVFENVNGRQGDFVDTAEGLASGGGWNRIIRVRSKKGAGEFTNIYMRPQGNRLGMLVTTVDNSDAVFLQVCIKPEELDKFIDEHRGERH